MVQQPFRLLKRVDGICQLLHCRMISQRRVLGPLLEAFGDVRVEFRRLGDQEGVEPPNPSFADDFNISQQTAVLVFDELGAVVSLPFQVHRLKAPITACLVAIPDACFKFADVGPEEAQHGGLANLLEVFASGFHDLSETTIVGVCA